MEHLLNQYSGPIFLIGTGPSLGVTGVPTGQYTFASSLYHRWKEGPVPSFYVVAEEAQCSHWEERGFPNAKATIAKFSLDWQPARSGWIPLKAHHYSAMVHRDGLGKYPMPHNAHCGPITALQIALWMGFDTFYLMGCDSTPMGEVYDANRQRKVGTGQLIEQWSAVARALPGKVIDCTPGGQLNVQGVLPYKPLEEVLG